MCVLQRFAAAALVLAAVLLGSPAGAQEPYQLLYGFSDPASKPMGPLTVAPDGSIYGCTVAGGAAGYGILFAIPTDGSGFRVLRDFDGDTTTGSPWGSCGLLLSEGGLFLTTDGGPKGTGFVYRVNLDGTDFHKVHEFSGSDGSGPVGRLLEFEGSLYGATGGGGAANKGVLYRLNKDGSGCTLLHTFSGPDGRYPSSIIELDGSLFGTTAQGGPGDRGTVFRVALDGSGFQVLHGFDWSDGTEPQSSLVAIGTTLYGTTPHGGPGAGGTLFKIEVDGTGFETLRAFSTATGGTGPSGLVESGGVLYGSLWSGGRFDHGILFALDPATSVLSTIHDLSVGYFDWGGLTAWGGSLFGATGDGGAFGGGNVFVVDRDGTNLTSLHDFAFQSRYLAQPFDVAVGGGKIYGIAGVFANISSGFLFSLADDGSQFQELARAMVYSVDPKPFLLAGDGLYSVNGYGGDVFGVNTTTGARTLDRAFVGATPGEYAVPHGLTEHAGVLYGSLSFGSGGDGALYRLNVDGSGFSQLQDIHSGDGHQVTGITYDEGHLYVSYEWGGDNLVGSLWRVGSDGSGQSKLHAFTAAEGHPGDAVTRVGDFLYGLTHSTAVGQGILYRIGRDGTGFTVLHSFQGPDGAFVQTGAIGSLLEVDGRLYGMAVKGGDGGAGVLFSIATDGSGFTKHHDFVYATGAEPSGDLSRLGSALVGAVRRGGPGGGGGVFRMFLPGMSGVSLTPRSVDFGPQPRGTTSDIRTLTLVNTGTTVTPLTVEAEGDFSQSNDCGTLLGPGAACTIQVTFAPTALGVRAGVVLVGDGVTSRPQAAALAGIGAEAAILPSITALYFLPQDSAAKPIRIQNTGGAALSLTDIQASTGFSEANDCGDILQPGSTCTASVTFAAASTAPTSGALTVSGRSATGDGSRVGSPLTKTVTLNGNKTAITFAPASLDFGMQMAGISSAWQTITMTAKGPVQIVRIAASPDYEVANYCSTGIMAKGRQCTLRVRFVPLATGFRPGSLSVVENVGGIAYSASLLGSSVVVTPQPSALTFGTQTVGVRSPSLVVHLTNDSGAPQAIGRLEATGDFQQTHDCPVAPATLVAGATCSISVTLTPSTAGTRTGLLAVTGPGGGSLSNVTLSGTGVGGLTPSRTTLAVGSAPVGIASAAKSLTFTNASGQPMPIRGVAASAEFSAASDCIRTLAAGESCTVSVQGTPSARGTRNGTLTLSADGPARTVSVSVIGTMKVSATSSVIVNGAAGIATHKTFTLNNPNGAVVAITALSATGPFSASAACGSSLPAFSTCTIDVTMLTTTAGPQSGTLTVLSSADNGSLEIPLSGTATFKMTVTPSSRAFGSVKVGKSKSLGVVLTNPNGIAMTLGAINAGDDYSLANGCGTSLAAGASCTVTVTLTPSSIGSHDSVLQIASNADASPKQVPLTGTGY